jgi:hypothetical protein
LAKIQLHGLQPANFDVAVKEYRPNKPNKMCSVRPAWVTTLKKNGTTLDIFEVVVRAGMHFADSINMAVVPAGVTREQFAASIAWALISMLDPKVVGRQLVLSKPDDDDAQRLGMEILGVGATLELLVVAKVIDPASLAKLHSTFDFEAAAPSGGSRVLIECKGTLDDGSRQKHQASIRSKLSGVPTRGYGAAVGVIFFGWSSKYTGRRFADFQLADPPGDHDPDAWEFAVRQRLAHFSRAFGLAGMPLGATALQGVAGSEQLPRLPADLAPELARDSTFRRTSMVLVGESQRFEFWGGFWNESFVPFGIVDDATRRRFPICFVGVDKRVVVATRQAAWGELLALDWPQGEYRFQFTTRHYDDGGRDLGEKDLEAILVRLRSGLILVWMSFLALDVPDLVLPPLPTPENRRG